MKFKIKINKIKDPPVQKYPGSSIDGYLTSQEYSKAEAYHRHMRMIKEIDIKGRVRTASLLIEVPSTPNIEIQKTKKNWFDGLNIFKKNK